MATLPTTDALGSYALSGGHLYHVKCGAKAEFQNFPSDDSRWLCPKCNKPNELLPWHVDFTLGQAKERGDASLQKQWVNLVASDFLEDIAKIDFHDATRDDFENSYLFGRPATDAEKVLWFHKMLLVIQKKELETKKD